MVGWRRLGPNALVGSMLVTAAGCGGPQLMPAPNICVDAKGDPFADVPAALRSSQVDLLYVTDRKPVTEKERRERALRKWHVLNGVEQTDQLFEKEIVKRMGKDFYENVFSPTIREARQQGKEYLQVRDSIRKHWKP